MIATCSHCREMIVIPLVAPEGSDQQKAYAFKQLGEEMSKHFQTKHPEVWGSALVAMLLVRDYVLSVNVVSATPGLHECRELVRTNLTSLLELRPAAGPIVEVTAQVVLPEAA